MESHAGRSSQVDWTGIAESSKFKELTRERRSFVVPATIFFLVWYFGFIVLASYADFMGDRIWEGLTVGYLFALSQFLMVWVLAGLYLRRSNRVLDPLRQQVVEESQGASSKRSRSSRTSASGNGGSNR